MKIREAFKETMKKSRQLLKRNIATTYIQQRGKLISDEVHRIPSEIAKEYSLLKSERKNTQSGKSIQEIDKKLFRIEILCALQATSLTGYTNSEAFYTAYTRMLERKKILQRSPNLDEEYLRRRGTVEELIGSPHQLENFENALRILKRALNSIARKKQEKPNPN